MYPHPHPKAAHTNKTGRINRRKRENKETEEEEEDDDADDSDDDDDGAEVEKELSAVGNPLKGRVESTKRRVWRQGTHTHKHTHIHTRSPVRHRLQKSVAKY